MPPNKTIDLAYNQLINGTTIQGIGYVETTEEEELALEIYRFIIESIRKEDKNLDLFNFVQGPQLVWEQIHRRIFQVKDLWNVSDIEDEYLQYLQSIVGWVGSLTKITQSLNYDTLRRLISVSVRFWKTRGSENSTINILSLATQAESRIWNWFDYRWIIDETQLTEEHGGRDSNIINLPGEPEYEEYQSNVRIVDNGNLDRTLVKNLLKLTRPCSERITITYIRFLDLFNVDDDKTKWTERSGDLIVLDGTAKFENTALGEAVYATEFLPTSYELDKYIIYFRVKVNCQNSYVSGIEFRSDGSGENSYVVYFDPENQQMVFHKLISGSISNINYFDCSTSGGLYNNLWYGLRLDLQYPYIKIYLDGRLIFNITDSTYYEGTFGFFTELESTIEVDEIEMFELPIETDTIGINE
ncbi:MAG: hypothetical protein BV456_06855 [Thermoplasmata archaeon M8B2D]|nr:MAG: hypothetical protein BV456_06855 [Thermoplasmata archaeon M8B2D]